MMSKFKFNKSKFSRKKICVLRQIIILCHEVDPDYLLVIIMYMLQSEFFLYSVFEKKTRMLSHPKVKPKIVKM